jgi:hypothetical protein
MTTNIQSFAGDVQIESGNLSVKSLEVRDGVTKLASNNTAYSNVGVMMTRKDGASNVAFLFSEDGANVVLGYTNDDALEGDQIDILVDEKANLVVYGNVYVTGSVHGDGSTLTGLVTTLQSVTEFGATTDQTLSLTNATTGMNVTSNVVVSGNVTALTFIGDGSQLDGIAATLEEIIINGNTTSNVVEFRNATSLVTTGNVGISNLAPTGDLCIGANVIINDESLDKIDVTGNIACHQLNLGSIEILPAYSLENVTEIGNTTPNVVSFKNTTLAFDTDRMAGIGIIPSAADVGVSGLHVDGHLRLGGAADNTDEEQMYVKAAGALGVLANQSDTDNTNTALRLQAGDTNDSNITLYGDLSTTTKQYISMATRNTERLRIDRDGNVGIGTTDPTTLLQLGSGDTANKLNKTETYRRKVSFDRNAYDYVYIGNVRTHTTGPLELDVILNNANTGYRPFKFVITLQGTDIMVYSSQGSLNNSALRALDVGYVYVGSGGNYEFQVWVKQPYQSTQSGTFTVYAKCQGYFDVDTGVSDVAQGGSAPTNFNLGTPALVLDSDGNVGIGTDTPAYALDVHGTANVGVLSATLPLATVASNLVTYDTATGQLLDSNGLVSNKLSIVSEQPPIALTGATTTVSGHGKYTIEVSSQVNSGNAKHQAFDKNDGTAWLSNGNYDANGDHTNSAVTLNSIQGEYIKLTLPYKTTLRHFTLACKNNTASTLQFPVDFRLFASNDDGVSWTTLYSQTGGATPSAAQVNTYVVNSSASYKTYALVIEKISSNPGSYQGGFSEWRLYTETFTVDAGKVNMTGASGLETGFTEHPVAPMTGYHTYVEGHGTYEASESSVFSGTTAYGWKIFDYETSTDWATNGGYDSSTGAFTSDVTTTDVGGTRYNGHWVQIKTPYPITLSHSNVYPTNVNRSPVDSVILGSNDGENWYKLNEFTGQTYSASTWKRLDVNATTPYQYYRMCVTKKATGDTVLGIREWRLFAEKDVTKFENVHISGDLSSETIQTGYIKWPRKPLKANESEGYVASQSSYAYSNYKAWKAFNENTDTSDDAWLGGLTNYTTGGYAITTSGAPQMNGVYGDWLGIELPQSIKVSYIQLLNRNYSESARLPTSGRFYGSKDNVTFTELTAWSNISISPGYEPTRIDVNSNDTYKTFRVQVERLYSGGTGPCAIGELQLFEAATGVGGAPTSAKLQVHGSLGLAKGSSLYAGDSVVAEFPKHDRPLTKYPEVAMTANSSGGYVADRSSVYQNSSAWEAWEMFNGIKYTSVDDGWSAYGLPYTDGIYGNSYKITDVNGVDYNGEWTSIMMPKPIKLSYFKLYSRRNLQVNTFTDRLPRDGTLLASHNGTDWYKIYSFTDRTYQQANYDNYFYVNDYTHYKHFVLVYEKLATTSSGNVPNIGEWELYGTEEGDESVDVVHRSVPNKPGTQHLEVYWDANDSNSYSFADSSNVYDLSGNGVTGALTNGVGFDPEYNAWTFDGSNDVIYGTPSGSITGEFVHSFAGWFYLDSETSTYDYPFFIGSIGSTNQSSILLSYSQRRIFAAFGYQYGFYPTNGFFPRVGQWYHACVTYSGGNLSPSSVKLYIDGVALDIIQDSTQTSALSIDANHISLGASNSSGTGSPTNGRVGNFRLFSKVLNADQVRELYEYDAPRFGHRTNVVALHKGNLGVGVTAPTSRFEVAGREDLQEYPPKAMTGYETYMEGHGVFKASASSTWSNNASYEAFGAFNKTLLSGTPDLT